MSKVQVVFLFDLSAFTRTDLPSENELRNDLLCLRSACLRLLTEFTSRTPNLRFSFKFFDLHARGQKRFEKYPLFEMNLETFEHLESELCLKYERYLSYCKLLVNSKTELMTNASSSFTASHALVNALNVTLKEILCDYEWDAIEISSPVKNKKFDKLNIPSNFVFLVCPCPVRNSDVHHFYGTDITDISSKLVQDFLMPSALHQKFINEAKISLIWLDSSMQNWFDIVTVEEYRSIDCIDTALRNLNGAMIPLQALSQACLYSTSTFSSLHMASSNVTTSYWHPGSLLPFSVLVSQYMNNKKMSELGTSAGHCCLYLSEHQFCDVKVHPLNLTQEWANEQSSGSKWKNFYIKGRSEKRFFGASNSSLICVPQQHSSEVSLVFFNLIQELWDKNLNLVLDCETQHGPTAIGIMSPLTVSSGLISIFFFYSLPTAPMCSRKPSLSETSDAIDELKRYLKEKAYLSHMKGVKIDSEGLQKEQDHSSTCLQIASLESWFIPSANTFNIASQIKSTNASIEPASKNFLKNLQNCYHTEYNSTPKKRKLIDAGQANFLRRSPRLKSFYSSSSFASSSFGVSDSEAVAHNSQQPSLRLLDSAEKNTPENETITVADCSNEVLQYIKNVYCSALKPSGTLISSAKSIVEAVTSFFQNKNETDIIDSIWEFAGNNLLVSPSKIREKYDGKSDHGRIKEYKLQVVLILELELTFPSSFENCTEMVTNLLRALSFTVGPNKLNTFLQDVVKENYGERMYHVLKEVGDELNVPIVGSQLFSPSSGSEMTSPFNTAVSSNLSCNSLMSGMSSSSMSSQRDLCSFKRTFSGNFQTRQIVVPKRLATTHSEQMVKVRKSPRLALRKQKTEIMSKENIIRRNLFSACYSPAGKLQRKIPLTPKGQHILKTRFVPETPSPKQGRSSIRQKQDRLRKAAGVNSDEIEVLESPCTQKKGYSTPQRKKKYKSNKNSVLKATLSEENIPNHSAELQETCDQVPSHSASQLIKAPMLSHCSKRLFSNDTPPKSESSFHVHLEAKSSKRRLLKRALVTPSTSSDAFGKSCSSSFSSNPETPAKSNSVDFVAHHNPKLSHTGSHNSGSEISLDTLTSSSQKLEKHCGSLQRNKTINLANILPSTSPNFESIRVTRGQAKLDESKTRYSSPTSESVLHLTTSPVLLLQKKRKKC